MERQLEVIFEENEEALHFSSPRKNSYGEEMLTETDDTTEKDGTAETDDMTETDGMGKTDDMGETDDTTQTDDTDAMAETDYRNIANDKDETKMLKALNILFNDLDSVLVIEVTTTDFETFYFENNHSLNNWWTVFKVWRFYNLD